MGTKHRDWPFEQSVSVSNGQTGFRLLGLAAALIFSRDALKEVLFLLREALHSTDVYLLEDRIQFETFAFECRQFGAAAARASAEVPVSEGLQRKKKGIEPQVDQQKAGSTADEKEDLPIFLGQHRLQRRS